MRRKLSIACPQCQGEESKFYYEDKLGVCSYCGNTKKVDILEHFKVLGINDERYHNVKRFVGWFTF